MTFFCLLSVQMYDILFIRNSGTVSAGLCKSCYSNVGGHRSKVKVVVVVSLSAKV